MLSIDPLILFFLLGLVARLSGSKLEIPKAIYEMLCIYLLLSIGLKGGLELAASSEISFIKHVIGVLAFGALHCCIVYKILPWIGVKSQFDRSLISAHYASVSVGTYAIVLNFIQDLGIYYESFMPVFVVLLEIPGIVVGLVLAARSGTSWWNILRREGELFNAPSIMLLVGALLIGMLGDPTSLAQIKQVLVEPFKGVLALFLLQMGVLVAEQWNLLGKFRRHALVVGILMPLLGAVLGIALSLIWQLSTGGALIITVLAASGSYIAVPSSFKLAYPKQDVSRGIVCALGISYPFNITIGIPLYYSILQLIG